MSTEETIKGAVNAIGPHSSPGDINSHFGRTVYNCRPCGTDQNLSWFNGTSCPVCDKPECTKALWEEWNIVMQRQED